VIRTTPLSNQLKIFGLPARRNLGKESPAWLWIWNRELKKCDSALLKKVSVI